jgi:hypothetical protein
MFPSVELVGRVRRIPFLIFILALGACCCTGVGLASLAPGQAQGGGARPSASSTGFAGGRAGSGVPSSVSSIAFRGPANRARGLAPSVSSPDFRGSSGGGSIRPRGHGSPYGPRGLGYGAPYYYVPYYPFYDSSFAAPDSSTPPADDEYQGGPTIFDRRGPGANDSGPSEQNEDSRAATPQLAEVAEAPQPDTVLVFRDGRQIELANYAIVGDTLFDLTDGHRRKIPLSELDLAGTSKENDDRGVDFQLPQHAR